LQNGKKQYFVIHMLLNHPDHPEYPVIPEGEKPWKFPPVSKSSASSMNAACG
jgi:hypothetical protein